MCIPEVSATVVFTMAEGDSSNSFFETDSDSVLSGSVCCFTELNEDDEVLSEVSLIMLNMVVYLFEHEQSSSESDEETLILVKSGLELWTGTMKGHYVLL